MGDVCSDWVWVWRGDISPPGNFTSTSTHHQHHRCQLHRHITNNKMTDPPSPNAHTPSLQCRTLSDADLHDVYASDQSMYPVPLPFSRLQAWVSAYPELSISFHSLKHTASGEDVTNESAVGIIIALPIVRKHWEDLLRGKFTEIEVDPYSMFPVRDMKGEQEVGLHVFHIERFSTGPFVFSADPKRRFYDVALDEVLGRVNREFKGWRVVGLSGMYSSLARYCQLQVSIYLP